MSEEPAKPEEQKAPEPAKRRVYILVTHEELNAIPSGWEMSNSEIPEKITGEVVVRIKDRGGKLKVNIEK